MLECMWTSPTGLDKFGRCKRLWAFDKIDKTEEPDTNAGKKGGTRYHAGLETIYQSGGVDYVKFLTEGEHTEMKDSGVLEQVLSYMKELVQLIQPHIPDPSDEVEVEKKISVKIGPHSIGGYIDLVYEDLTGPVVVDYKSKNTLHYIPSAEELRQNIQANVYAAAAMNETGCSSCLVKFIYFLRRPITRTGRTKVRPKVKVVQVRLDREEVDGVLHQAARVCSKMDAVKRDHKRALDVVPSPSGCSMYGGCGFKPVCWGSGTLHGGEDPKFELEW